MNNIRIFIILLLILNSCSQIETDIVKISDKEKNKLEWIQEQVKANRIDYKKVKNKGQFIDSSICITIVYNRRFNFQDTLLRYKTRLILLEFVESYYPEIKYNCIELGYREEFNALGNTKFNEIFYMYDKQHLNDAFKIISENKNP